MTFLDTNIILRYVLSDDAPKAARCDQLFNKTAQGKLPLLTHVLAIAEVVWVLTGRYGLPKEQVVDALMRLLTMEALVLEDKERVLSALGLYRAQPIDFIDAYHAYYLQDKGLNAIYSYDTDFDLISGLHRLEP